MSGVVTVTGQTVRNNLVKNYFHDLVNRFFKILPMRENGEESLTTYMRSLRVELIGGKGLLPELQVNSSYEVLTTIFGRTLVHTTSMYVVTDDGIMPAITYYANMEK